MTVINILDNLTAGEIWGHDLEQFKRIYGDNVVETLKLADISDFAFYDANNKEILIYSGSQVLFSCNYSEYNCKKHVATCWTINGFYTDLSC